MADTATAGWPASVGLIGAGAMGRALLAGLARTRPGWGARCRVADAVPEAAAAGAAEVGGATGSAAEAAAADLVILAVKPKDVARAMEEAGAALRADAVVLSVAAGWDLARLRAAAPAPALVRTMPNLAVRHGAGLVAFAADGLDAPGAERVHALLAPLGEVVPLPEALFPAATALAGSGPGLVALIAEAMEEGGVRAGLTREQARAMARGVLAGTAALLADGTDPAVLRQRVSSPAGTTVAGVAVLERGAVRGHVADAVLAAARRAAEL